MAPNPTSLTSLAGVMLKEGRRRILPLTAMFSVGAVLALAVVLTMPRRYDASTLIVVDANNIIKPLMEGRAVPTSIADQTAVINQIVLGRKVLRELLVFGGWVKPPPARQPDPREEERLLLKVKAHIKIETTLNEMIRISYSDSEPQRTYLVTNKIAEIYLRESQEGKARESREAFEFIDKQVKEYGDKLADIHQKVLTQYREALPHPAGSDSTPKPPPLPRSKVSPDELAAMRAEEAQLEAQVSRKPAAPTAPRTDARAEEQLRNRVLQLQGELDRLRTTYTDEHPDVRRMFRELNNTKAELERSERLTADREAAAQVTAQADDDVARAARARLDEVRRRIAAATGTPVRRTEGPITRVAGTPDQIDPEMRTVGLDTTLSELLRRYEATRDIYQDLLRRRDNARFSMELDQQQRGLTMHVQEPAELPASPSSLRLFQLALIALIMALALPLGFLAALVRFDRRVRSTDQIAKLVPLLGSISDVKSHRQMSVQRNRVRFSVLMLAAVFVVYLAVFIFRLKTSG